MYLKENFIYFQLLIVNQDMDLYTAIKQSPLPQVKISLKESEITFRSQSRQLTQTMAVSISLNFTKKLHPGVFHTSLQILIAADKTEELKDFIRQQSVNTLTTNMTYLMILI